jgi:hypothetical protein
MMNLNPALVHPRLLPELACDLERVGAGRLPPCSLIASPVHGAVMDPAKRDSEFVARLAAERARLHVPKMMRVRWPAAANEARLLGDVAQVLSIAVAPRGRDRENALVDALRLISVDAVGSGLPLQLGNLRHRSLIVRGCSHIGGWELR